MELQFSTGENPLRQGREWILANVRGRVGSAFHPDADGASAAALAAFALEKAGFAEPLPLAPGKGETIHEGPFLERVHENALEALMIFDMGSRAGPILNKPILLVDHHQPEGFPAGSLPLSAFGSQPEISTSLLSYLLFSEITDLHSELWVALIGAVGDLGMRLPFPELRAALQFYGQTNVREAVSLVNAAKRSSAADGMAAYKALREASGPKDIARGETETVRLLRGYREEVNAALKEAGRAAPKFSGKVALVRFRSACQVHGLLAARWTRRLPGYLVLSANEGYLPGKVNFSMRTAADVDLIAFLKRHGKKIRSHDFARGHTRATGGILSHEEFAVLLRALGFPE